MKNNYEQGIERLTANLILVPSAAAFAAHARLILDGEGYALLRRCPGERAIMVRNGDFHGLTDEDHEAINDRCDNREGPSNVTVKKNIARAFKNYFGEMAMNLYEIGCGKHPILKYFYNPVMEYHGIDRSAHCVEAVRQAGISASTWEGLTPMPLPLKNPSFCVGVYSLHFMVDKDLPARLQDLTSKHGFYVGNLYRDPAERRSGAQRQLLEKVLNRAGMAFCRVADPEKSYTNEYLVIGQKCDRPVMDKFAHTLGACARMAAHADSPPRRAI